MQRPRGDEPCPACGHDPVLEPIEDLPRSFGRMAEQLATSGCVRASETSVQLPFAIDGVQTIERRPNERVADAMARFVVEHRAHFARERATPRARRPEPAAPSLR